MYFPIKSIIGRIRKYKRIAKLADDVADEYEQSFKPPQESNERQEEQTKVTLSEEEMKQMNYKAPTFAKRNRGFYVVLHFVGIAIIEAAGIGMLLHPEGNNMYGWICVGAGVVYLIACSIYFLTEFKGKEVYGKLLSIERRKLYHGYREYVLVAYKGKVKNLSLPFDSVNNNQWDYNDGMALLKSHIGKEIPLRVLCGNIIIDWKKLYWKAKSNSR